MPIKNIIFDWSGVISDDQYTTWLTYSKIMKKHGLKAFTFEEYRKNFYLPYPDFYKEHYGMETDELEADWKKYSEITALPEIFPEAKEVLEKLNKRGFHIALFTSMSSCRLKEEIEKYSLEDFFKNAMADIRNKVEAINSFINSHGYERSETVYVGDMVHDIHAAKEAGIKSIAITRGWTEKKDLAAENPDVLIDDLTEIFDAVEKLQP